jgi:tRNA-Thr(GGU) m(6)t(6)A37 methyltransferase TsaA
VSRRRGRRVAQPVPVPLEPIGRIRTRYTERRQTPVQTALNPAEEGTVELDAPYRAGLVELETFDYAWLLTWLTPDPDDPVPTTMQQVPFLLTNNRRPIGLFAMRGPRRPNPIGLHLVRVLNVTAEGFRFGGVDMIDGTPLLDIKPWAAPLDMPHATPGVALRNGWFDTVDLSGPHTPQSLRRVDDA